MSELAVCLGIRPRPFRAFTRALLLMGLRIQHFARATGAKPGELIPPLFWVVGQYVLASGLLSAALFARVDVWTFAFCGLATSMLLMATAVVVELHEAVVAPDDPLIVGHRPLPARTYAAARLIHLGFFVTLLTLAANLFPAILGAALRDSGAWYLPAYLLAAFAGNAAVTAAIILLTARGGGSPARTDLRDLLAWTQIVLVMVVFYGAQWMLRDGEHRLLRFFARPPDWLLWLPPAWLASFVAGGAVGEAAALRGAVAVLAVSGLAALLIVVRLSALYSWGLSADPALEREGAGAARRTGRLVGPLAVAGARSRPQRAVLALCLTLLRRDVDLRMRTLPSLATVAAVVVLGLATGQLASPFTGTAASAALSLAAVQLVVLAVPVMLQSLLSSRHHAASWLLAAAPWPAAGIPARASRAAICYGVALPALLVLGAVFAWAWQSPAQAALHVLFGWIEVLAVGWGSLTALRFDLPFSRPVAVGGASGGEATPWLAAVGAVAFALGAAEMQAAAAPPWLLAYGAALVALWLVLWRRARA